MRTLKDLCSGVIKHPYRTACHAFVAFSVLWTFTEAFSYLLSISKIKGPLWLGAFILISLCCSLIKAWKPFCVELKVANSDTTIQVLFGDLFAQNGIRAVAVSEFFESEIGKPVSDRSLHGILLTRCFGGQPESFDKQVNDNLIDTKFVTVCKKEGKSRSYPIGTTALLHVNDDSYLLFALTKADPETCKAYSDVNMMWKALHCLWQRARTEAGGDPINIPLVGSGLSGLGLPARDLLNLIILSAINETRRKQIARTIRIVLHRDRFEELDLREIKRHWRE